MQRSFLWPLGTGEAGHRLTLFLLGGGDGDRGEGVGAKYKGGVRYIWQARSLKALRTPDNCNMYRNSGLVCVQ